MLTGNQKGRTDFAIWIEWSDRAFDQSLELERARGYQSSEPCLIAFSCLEINDS